ncbi:DinB family protein [Paenibacillus thalictri]|uniref:DinB family protein n=1 Tax=Paenibacillus thalictri TaxID=2527873 RepID=A0A4V6MSF6_9BACL|nr:DinB family protein [Paenibacillus thalictri]TBL76110.1 DinB family protein [Paenibacillus thalictri]
MRESIEFRTFREVRTRTLALAESSPLEIVDIVPQGFNNSIRWNLGHILVAWDHGIFPKLGEEWRVPKSYHHTFPKGTRPSGWTTEPPAYSEILEKLRSQVDDIIVASTGKLDDPIAKPFLRIKRLRGMFHFHNREEQHHLDCMLRIKQAIEMANV